MLLSHPSDVGSLVGDGREEMPTMTHEHLPGRFSAKIKGTKSDILLAHCFYCSTDMSSGSRGQSRSFLPEGTLLRRISSDQGLDRSGS